MAVTDMFWHLSLLHYTQGAPALETYILHPSSLERDEAYEASRTTAAPDTDKGKKYILLQVL